ncbi:MAG: hypothetical protein KGZ33_07425 [Alkaliphilus sp.]|nr:hypothetical protein [Alkaliphilus sp.]MBS3995612.1 hypothetical protein [Alkaliphilus sp.]
MEELSQIRQKICQLNQKRWRLLKCIMNPGKLLTASFYERFTKCGSRNCKCASGELHGPFPWIYQNRKGEKLISTSCVQDKVKEAQLFSENYKSFKEKAAKIKQLDEEIHRLIVQIESLNEADAKEFTRKEGEKRGRKPKNSEESLGREEN